MSELTKAPCIKRAEKKKEKLIFFLRKIILKTTLSLQANHWFVINSFIIAQSCPLFKLPEWLIVATKE